MEQQQQTKGIGKESQLSKIAAAVNPGSMAEANPTATQSMISTFMQTFESSALELREETNDDQKALIKTMIDEITKLQTKNMKEFEKAIGKIVSITKDLQKSDNPILQKLGKEMEEKSREEAVKASGYTLTGEKDTFLNRLGRSVGMNTEEEPIEKNRQGIGKLVKGFASNLGRDVKRGFKIAVGSDPDQEGTFYDNVVRSDTEKRERLLTRIDSESNQTQSVSASDTFKKVIEEYFKEEKQKSESSEKEKKSSTLSVDELSAVHELIQNKQGSEQEQKILTGILNFGNTDVKQVMTPRTNIIALDLSHSFHMVLREIQASGFSRIPMYEDNVDKITGVLYIKDLLPYLEENDTFQWQQFKRKAYFIPESKKLDDLLKEFQEMKMHVAVVVDEYGGTSGIISLEDVIEEIVGDLNDEYDDENIVYSKLDNRNYIFDGKTLLVDMYRILDLDETLFEAAKGEADTIAGFILEQTGVFPKKDAIIDFGGVKFKIDSIDKRRIISVKITLNDVK